MKIQLGLLLLLASYFQKITRQDHSFSILTGKVEIEAANEPISSILQKIEAQTSLYFSYDSKTINTQKRITISFKAKTLSQAIALIFNDAVLYKVKGDYIVLYKATPVKANAANKDVAQTKNNVPKKSNTTSEKKEPLPFFHLKDSLKTSDYSINKRNTDSTNMDTVLINDDELIYPKLRLINDDTAILILEEEPLENP